MTVRTFTRPRGAAGHTKGSSTMGKPSARPDGAAEMPLETTRQGSRRRDLTPVMAAVWGRLRAGEHLFTMDVQAGTIRGLRNHRLVAVDPACRLVPITEARLTEPPCKTP